MFGAHETSSEEGRISHDVVEFFFWNDGVPVDAEGVPFDDVRIGTQGEKVEGAVDNGFGLFHHLAFGNPKGCFGNGDGKIVDFNTEELSDGNLNRIDGQPGVSVTVEHGEYFVFHAAE